MPDDKKISAPDLTKRPPRSPRQRLGGYALLPRMLDKGRAEIAGTSGEYHYNCPLDQRILNFLGLDPGALREQLANGRGCHLQLNRRLARGCSPRSLQLNAKNFCSEIVDFAVKS
jgi:hypothetical protein